MSTHVWIWLDAAVPSLVVALVGYFLHHKIEVVHLEINSRMTQLLEVTKLAARAEGFKSAQDGITNVKDASPAAGGIDG